MKFIDLFAGIGGFRSGLEKAGHQCIGYIEWDKFARQSYEAIYDTDGEFTAHDIQEVKGEQLPNAELWTFGSPCTNISIAGNRIGIRGDESRMFFEVIRLLKERIKYQKTLPISSWKTLKICYQAMKDGTLPKLSIKWTQSGTMLNGAFSTLPKSSLNTGNVFTLSDILEKDVSDKYFLSKDKVKILLNQQK